MDKAKIQAAFTSAGLVRLEKDIDLIALDSIRVYATPVDDSTLPVGASKIGGVPDLPATTMWPEWNGIPQSFIAQIRFDDVHAFDTQNLLPSDGMLWFFYDAKQETYGENPSDSGGWRIFYAEHIPPLQRIPAPATLPSTSRFGACSLTYSVEITLDQQPQLDIPHFDWTEEEQQKYEQLLASFPIEEARTTPPHHRLLGYPDTIQDDMRVQCELVSQGVTNMDDPRAAALEKSANEWQLLLQIDTDERIGMRWASSGMLYVWIKRDDLRSHAFEHTWLILQSE